MNSQENNPEENNQDSDKSRSDAISRFLGLSNEQFSQGFDLSSLRFPIFIIKDDDFHERTEGHDINFFLPVYRISIEDDLDKNELVSKIIEKKPEIIQAAKDSLEKLTKEDSLRPLFEEAVALTEEGRYIGSQSILANIYNLIRDNRFREKPLVRLEDNEILVSFEDTSWEDTENLINRISSNYTENDVKLALMTGYVFTKTFMLLEGHKPHQSPSRNAMTHTGAAYYSQYNCLCFLLYISEVFDLIYKLESMPGSLVKPRIEWLS